MPANTGRLPWKAMWDLLACVGGEGDFRSLVSRTLAELPRVLSCDFSYACISDGAAPPNGKPFDLCSIGLSDKSRADYLAYYYRLDPVMLSLRDNATVYDMDWRDSMYRDNEFVEDFLGPLSATVNAGMASVVIHPETPVPEGFALGFMRCGRSRLSERDRRILSALRPHLANYREIMSRCQSLSPDHYFAAELARDCRILSKREVAVAQLLCKRLRPREIATVLLISPRTVERHIEHIYEKLNVSSRRQLLQKLLGRVAGPGTE